MREKTPASVVQFSRGFGNSSLFGLLRFKIGVFVNPWHSALQEIPATTNALGAGWQSPSTQGYHLLGGTRTCVLKNVNASLWYARSGRVLDEGSRCICVLRMNCGFAL
jgi:hypothetical protein